MKEFIKRNKVVITLICFFSILLIGGTYALLTIELFGEKSNSIIVGTLELELDESTCTGINISNGIPVLDEDGMKEVACTFTLENTGEIDSSYTIYLDDDDLLAGELRMNDNDVKYSLMKNSLNNIDYLSQTGTHPNRVLDNGILTVGSSNSYELRLWIAENASIDAMGKVVVTTLRVTSEVYQPVQCSSLTEYNDEANPPELVTGMIPIVYDETKSSWVKANANNPSDSWYNYDEQMWANAVTVTETNRAYYLDAAVGTVIPISEINTFMVWVPRYSYTIKDTYGYQGYGGNIPTIDTPGAFDVRFVRNDLTCLGTAKYTGGTAENWFTNSAFCWGNSCDDPNTRANLENTEISGIWVGKFEASTDENYTPKVLPNVTSWRGDYLNTGYINITNQMNGELGESIYGFTYSDYDAHLMKNTEWGAVAYLSQSKYGKYGNIKYVGNDKRISLNNCSTFITGIGGNTVSDSSSTISCSTNTYETALGQAASTTGNITGIYDMSGGADEYVMGNAVLNTSGHFAFNLSNITVVPESKYFNKYAYSTSTNNRSHGILGDATTETTGFGGNSQVFPVAGTPWFQRGGRHYSTTSGGIFRYYYSSGDTDNNRTYRPVVTLTN